jgi:hypothetical protein
MGSMFIREELQISKLACAKELLAQGTVLPGQALDLIKYAEKDKVRSPNLKKFLVGQAVGTAATGAGFGATSLFQDQLDKYMGLNPERAQELLQKLKDKSPIPVHDVPGFNNAAYIPGPLSAKAIRFSTGAPVEANSIAMGSGFNSPHVLAHELGHADIGNSRLGKLLQNTPTALLGNFVNSVGAISGLTTGLKSDRGSKARKWGIAAPALAVAPQLLFEAGATALGLRRLKGSGASGKELLQSLKTLGPAYGTYLARAVKGVGTAAVTQGIGGAIRDRRKRKTAEVSPELARRSLDRLDAIEKSKPTARQAVRYGAIGGVGGAGIGAIGHMIERGSPFKGVTPKAKALNFAANAAKGAIGGGAIPLIQNSIDRRAEVGTLRKYMQENTGASNA